MRILDWIAVVSAVGLLAIWGLYPAVIGVVSALRRTRRSTAGYDPSVSVVLATREPTAALVARVTDLLETDYDADRIEIIVAYDRGRPTPDFSGVTRGASSVRTVLADEVGGKAGALNAGLRAATGEIVVFADTYQRYERGTIPALATKFEDPRIGAVTGSYRLAAGSGAMVSMYWTFERWLRRAEARLHSSVGATGAVYAIRRNLWKPLPAGLILDDVFTPMNVVLSGSRVGFADGALALETRTPTPSQEYGRKVRTLTGVLQLCAWLPGVLNPIRNPIWLQFVFHKLLRLLTPYLLLGIAAWIPAALISKLEPAALVALAVAIIVGFVWITLSRSRQGTRIRRIGIEALLIQKAVLMAGINGLRGRWQVWDA